MDTAQQVRRHRGAEALLDGEHDGGPHGVASLRLDAGERVVHGAVAGQELPAGERGRQDLLPHAADE